jgi:hypothetical protein
MDDMPELPEESGPEEGGDAAANAKATYSGPEKRCINCEHFDGEAQCNLGKFAAAPDGTCEEFKVAGGGEEETGGIGEMDNLPDLEGLEA